MKTVQTLSEFCEAAGLPATAVPELVAALQERETLELARHEAAMRKAGGARRPEALPLCELKEDGSRGDEFGVVEARIPKTLFWNLMTRDGFGWEGLTSDEGMRDILKDNPQCRVKTVSGRLVSGWTPGRKTVKKYS